MRMTPTTVTRSTVTRSTVTRTTVTRTTTSPRTCATLRFFMEADRLKEVERRNHLASGSRRENTAEHSWHLGIAAMIMAPFASEPVDLATAVCMALVHDIVEIDAGDTFAYDESAAAQAGKKEREDAAADRLFGLLPPATWVSASGRCGTSTSWATPRSALRDGRRPHGPDAAEHG